MSDPLQAMYDAMAETYDKMVDAEIDLPVYADALSRLAADIAQVQGPVVDVACGSGQMLQRYRERYDPDRALVGVDLSPAMVGITRKKLPHNAEIRTGDMRSPGLSGAAALICWFALHHLEAAEAVQAVHAWYQALAPGGRLSLATWEGEGLIDYGGAADIEAWRYSEETVRGWVEEAGFSVERCEVRPVEGMPMPAVYLDARK